MVPHALRHEPLFDVHPRTGVSFEVFYSDRTLETLADTALVGSGGRGDAGARQTVQQLAHLLRATQRTATR